MSTASWHLIVVHAPLWVAATALWLLLWATLRGREELKRTALVLVLAGGLLTLPAYATGAASAQQLRQLTPAVPAQLAERHAQIAVLALGLGLFLAATAALVLWRYRGRQPLPPSGAYVVLAVGLIALVSLVWTSNLGGQIRHPEIGPPPGSAP